MSMTDHELLELAAKAHGDIQWDGTDPASMGCRRDGRAYWWRPMDDNGDALLLAMKLGICIQFIPECDTVQVYQERTTTGEPFNIHVAAIGDIELRRVIVQAAAEIGKSMQEAAA